MQRSTITASEPDEAGHWGKFGGRYVPETLVAPLDELTREFSRARDDANFGRELDQLRRRLQLRLHEHDFLAGAGPAVADGDQSADHLRTDVRRWRLAGAAQGAP